MPASDLVGPAPKTKKGREALADGDELRRLHVDQAMNAAQISHRLGVSWWEVWERLLELGINRTPPPKPFTVPELADADTLRRLHVTEGKSLAAIAKLAGCSPFDVGRALHRHGIPQRTQHRVYPMLADGDLLRRWYETEEMSASEIARRVGCTDGAVTAALVRHGITPRARRRYPELADGDLLRRWYETEGRSVTAIAADVGCVPQTVSAALTRHGIVARPSAQRPAGLDDKELLAGLRADGLSIEEIAERVGASPSATRAALTRHGLTANRRSRYPQLDDVAALRRKAGSGMSAAEIAAEIGCTSRAVRDAFARHGLDLPDQRVRYPQLDDAEYLDLMYNQRFLSASAIAAEVGCSTSAVYGALRRAGIPTGTPPPVP